MLQGVGGGMMTPVGLAMLFRAFPSDERVRASAILIVPTTLAPALGPIIGGLLVTDLSWRWVFYVNVPLGILALGFGVLFLDGGETQQPGPFDTAGFLLSGAGLGLLMYGLSEGPIRHWTSGAVLFSIFSGAALLAVLVVTELRMRQPLIDLRLLSNRLFRSCNGVMFLGSAAFIGTLYVVTLFFQDGRGLSALVAGLSTFPEALGVMAGSQLASRVLYPVLGPRPNIALGLLGVASAIGLMSLIGAQTSLWWMRVLMFCLGIAMGQVFVPSQAGRVRRDLAAGDRACLDHVQCRPPARQRDGGRRADHGAGHGRRDHLQGGAHGPQPNRLPRRVPGRSRCGGGGCHSGADHSRR